MVLIADSIESVNWENFDQVTLNDSTMSIEVFTLFLQAGKKNQENIIQSINRCDWKQLSRQASEVNIDAKYLQFNRIIICCNALQTLANEMISQSDLSLPSDKFMSSLAEWYLEYCLSLHRLECDFSIRFKSEKSC